MKSWQDVYSAHLSMGIPDEAARLFAHHAVFCAKDLEMVLGHDEAVSAEITVRNLLDASILVPLSCGDAAMQRYTLPLYQEGESAILSWGEEAVNHRNPQLVVASENVDAYLKAYTALQPSHHVLDERLTLLRRVFMSSQRLVILLGPPGSSKTRVAATIMRGYAQYKEFPLLAIAQTTEAAAKLGGSAGIDSYNIKTFLESDALQSRYKNGIIAIDEACMLDIIQMKALVEVFQGQKISRVILIGDERQEVPEGAGSPVRLLLEAYRKNLDIVVPIFGGFNRQRNEPHKNIVENIYNGHPHEALRRMRYAEMLNWVYPKFERATLLQRVGKAMARYRQQNEKRDRRGNLRSDGISSLLAITMRDADVEGDNIVLRDVMISRGVIRDSAAVTDRSGRRQVVGTGERIILRETMRSRNGHMIPEGSFVTLTGRSGRIWYGRCDLKLADHPILELPEMHFPAFSYAYSLPLRQAQGQAMDAVFVLVDAEVDGNKMVTLCSRHRYTLVVYVDRTIYGNSHKLAEAISIFPGKENIADYI